MSTATKTLTYKHPQGATIVVRDGVLYATDAAGKPKKTSATVEKLAAGHGQWVLVEDSAESEANDLAELFPGAVIPGAERIDPRTVVAPMRFAEGNVDNLGAFVNDGTTWLQQKVDGVRGVLDFRAGHDPSFRSSSGKPLVSSAAAPAISPILKRLTQFPHVGQDYSVDGEILDGVFYVFDYVTHGAETTPFMFRHAQLEAWVKTEMVVGISDRIKLLPTAKDRDSKLKLIALVKQRNGEGWMAKGDDTPYDWGSRVKHSLKLKRTHTADLVVMARDTNGKENFTLGVWTPVGLRNVGQASAIGKVAAPVGSVVEVKYLYVGAGGKLVQPTVLRKRTDKLNENCTEDQLVPVDKSVFDLR